MDPDATSPEAGIVARVLEDPTDSAAYAVYGDWLQRQGDPRGELIALQLAREAELARSPKGRSTVVRAIARHFERHAGALYGELLAFVADVREPAAPPFVWRRGFIQRVVLGHRSGDDLGAIVGQVLRHPSGRLVQELAIRCGDPDEAHRVIDAIAERAPPALRELDLVVPGERNGERLDLLALWPSVPRLARLSVVAQAFDLGALAAPAAQRVRLYTARISVDNLRSIAAAPWPVLERLELRMGGRNEPSRTELHDLQPLLERTDLPALTHLKLRGCAYAGEALAQLARTALARQLAVIDLSHGFVEQADLRALAPHVAAFPALRELWLPHEIMPGAERALAGIAAHVISDARGLRDTFDDDVAPPAPVRAADRDRR